MGQSYRPIWHSRTFLQCREPSTIASFFFGVPVHAPLQILNLCNSSVPSINSVGIPHRGRSSLKTFEFSCPRAVFCRSLGLGGLLHHPFKNCQQQLLLLLAMYVGLLWQGPLTTPIYIFHFFHCPKFNSCTFLKRRA